jgi:hypothetical protein
VTIDRNASRPKWHIVDRRFEVSGTVADHLPMLGLNVNGSLYPWIAPFVLALVSAALLASGNYVGGAIAAFAAVAVRWLHQIAIDRGETSR